MKKVFMENEDDPFQVVQQSIKSRIPNDPFESKTHSLNKPVAVSFPTNIESGHQSRLHQDFRSTNSGINSLHYSAQSRPSHKNDFETQTQESEKRNPYIQNFFAQQIQSKNQYTDTMSTSAYSKNQFKEMIPIPANPKIHAKTEQEISSQSIGQLLSATKATKDKKGKGRYREKHSEKVYTGVLKFFDEKNGFVFITCVDKACDPFDVFIYHNEFKRAKIDMETIRLAKKSAVLTFEFQTAIYKGKGSTCKKAINIQLIDVVLPPE